MEAGKLFEFNNNFMDTPLHLDFIHLFQFGELGMSRKMEISLHNQVCHEISYVVSGSGVMYSDDKAFPISRGDVHVISKGSDHRIVADKEQGLHFIYLGFMLEQYPGMEDIMEFYSKSPSTIVRDESSLNFILEQLIDEMYHADKYHKIVLEMGIKQILIHVYRLFNHIEVKKYSPTEGGKIYGHTFYELLRYIDNNITKTTTVSQIAASLSYSESYLSHLFKKKVGISIQEYISRKRIERSLLLLSSGKYSVKDISEILKYESPKSFTKAFKKHMNCTPTEYKIKSKKAD